MSALPKNSLVLVTGANGFIASHIVDQALQLGYRVRGVVREESKAKWLKEHSTKYGDDMFEIAVVPDITAKGAFDEAVKGVSAFIHLATDASFNADPNIVIPISVNGTLEALNAANSEPSMEHFVYCSSSAAACLPRPNMPFEVDENSWNDTSVRLAWNPESPGLPDIPPAVHVYAASKVEAERAVWKYVQEQQPKFTVNTILPWQNWGPILHPKSQQFRSSAAVIPGLYTKGLDGIGFFKQFPPQHFIDVRDSARLHLAPLLDPTIKNERLFAWNIPYNWKETMEIIRKLRPNYEFQSDPTDDRRDMISVPPKHKAEQVLRKNFGVTGFIPMEESIAASIAHLP